MFSFILHKQHLNMVLIIIFFSFHVLSTLFEILSWINITLKFIGFQFMLLILIPFERYWKIVFKIKISVALRHVYLWRYYKYNFKNSFSTIPFVLLFLIQFDNHIKSFLLPCTLLNPEDFVRILIYHFKNEFPCAELARINIIL